MVFHSDSKTPQVSRSILFIQADLNNVVVYMLSAHLIPKSSNPCTSIFVSVPSTPIKIGITATFMLHSFFFQFSCKVLVTISTFVFF